MRPRSEGRTLGVRDLARYLHLSERVIYALCRAGTLPVRKTRAGAWRVTEGELSRWLDRQMLHTMTVNESWHRTAWPDLTNFSPHRK